MLTMSVRSGWSTDSDDDSLDAGGLPEEATSPIIRPSTSSSQKRLSLPGGMALEDSFAELMGGPATTSKGRAGGLSDFDDDDQPPPRPATSSSALGGRAGLSSGQAAASEARGSSTGSALGTARPQTAPARQVRREAWQQTVSRPPGPCRA